MSKADEKWLLWNLFYNLVILFTQSLNDGRVILCWFCVRTTKVTCHLLYLFQALKPTSIWEPKFDVPKTGMLMCKVTYSVLLWYLLDLCRTSMKKCFCEVFFLQSVFCGFQPLNIFTKKFHHRCVCVKISGRKKLQNLLQFCCVAIIFLFQIYKFYELTLSQQI